MTSNELIAAVANDTGKSKKDVKLVLAAILKHIRFRVVDLGGEVKLPGFGCFIQYKTRTGTCFGRKNTQRVTFRLRPYASRKPI